MRMDISCYDSKSSRNDCPGSTNLSYHRAKVTARRQPTLLSIKVTVSAASAEVDADLVGGLPKTSMFTPLSFSARFIQRATVSLVIGLWGFI